MNRRGAVLGAVGAVAAVAGAGLAWYRQAGAPESDSIGAGAGSGSSTGAGSAADAAQRAREALASLWTLRPQRPEGGSPLAIADARGRPLVVNFWATWCAPCVEELPLLDRFFRAARSEGWQVVGLAIDGAEPVRRFLQRQPVSFPVGLLGADGIALTRALGNEVGGLPFSVLIDAPGRLVDRRLGRLDEARLAVWKQRAGNA